MNACMHACELACMAWCCPSASMLLLMASFAALGQIMTSDSGLRPTLPTSADWKFDAAPEPAPGYEALLQRCWAQAPEHRPSFDQVPQLLGPLGCMRCALQAVPLLAGPVGMAVMVHALGTEGGLAAHTGMPVQQHRFGSACMAPIMTPALHAAMPHVLACPPGGGGMLSGKGRAQGQARMHACIVGMRRAC